MLTRTAVRHWDEGRGGRRALSYCSRMYWEEAASAIERNRYE